MPTVIDPALARDQEKRAKKKRRELLALLALVSARIMFAARKERLALAGWLVQMTNADGVIDRRNLPVIRNGIHGVVFSLATEIDRQVQQHFEPAAKIGAEMAGGEPVDGWEVALDVASSGAAGVPFGMVVHGAASRAERAIVAAVTTDAAMSRPLKSSLPAIIDALEVKLGRYAANDAEMQLSATFTHAGRETAAKEPSLEGFYWRMSPIEPHCDECPRRDGRLYPPDALELKEIPLHNHCRCWAEPKYRG